MSYIVVDVLLYVVNCYVPGKVDITVTLLRYSLCKLIKHYVVSLFKTSHVTPM